MQRETKHHGALAPTLASLGAAHGASPREAFDRIAREGFRFVQLSAAQAGMRPREMGRSARRDLLTALRSRGLRPSGIDLFLPIADLRSSERVDVAVTRLIEAIEFAADLGRLSLSVALDPAQDGVIRSVADAAQRYGVRVADHALHGGDIPEFDRGVDSAAVLAAGRDPVSELTAAGPRLACVRLCDLKQDGERGPLGDGRAGRLDVVAFRATAQVLRRGDEASVVIDARRWSDPWSGILTTAQVWHDAAHL